MSGSEGNIKVVVRCRPLNSRELARGAKGLIRMEGGQTILNPPEAQASSSRAASKKPMVFSFDKSYWSAGPRDEAQYASQETLYDDLGVELLDHSFEGFNTCIFAYGQTGSGKSYSMMGYGADKGIIPLTTSELFRRVETRSAADPALSYTVEVSYIEIYNEKVRDLLNPKNKGNLRVREHPSLGPYVEDLSRLVVENYGQMMTLMDEGNKARTVASTNMNETSSRSHAVFTVILTQKRSDAQTKMTGEKVSKISLVDLAGSERQASTGATGTRLKEGANINKSLTTLGKVIAALAQASDSKGKKRKDDFVPYRDSVLTWLLKESLGGNSKTAMIAAISPADYEETLSTLRYADAAKKIKTHAVVNEDPNEKLIRELREELETLRTRVAGGDVELDASLPLEKQIITFTTKDGETRRVSKLELQDQLEASEKLMEGLNQTWEEKMERTRTIHLEREKALEEMGISIDKDMVGVHAPQKHPSLVNLNEDPLMSECLVYQLKPGSTLAGSHEGTAQVKLSGSHILPSHCVFDNVDGIVSVEAMQDARTFVNGKRVPPETSVRLYSGYRVILGDFHVFRFNDPAAVRKQRQMASSASMDLRPDSPAGEDAMDWTAARREVADIEKLGDQDLDKLFDDIVKVRTQRKRPESRVDLDVESRFMASQTEETLDTLGNPWAAPGETVTTASVTPFGASDGAVTPEKADMDASLEQRHLTEQLRTLAKEVKRIRAQAAKARALERQVIEPETWSARDLRLVRWTVDRWRMLRGFKMAEEILTGAVHVREANVVARQLGKAVGYNFLVVDGRTASPTSALDDLNGVVEFDDVSSGIGGGSAPAVVVKVVDREAEAVYLWSLARFHAQLSKMRQVQTHSSRPGYASHFRADEPFVDSPPPSFSHIGTARFPLRLLAHGVSAALTIPIVCPYTMEAIGSCRVDVGIRAASAPLLPGTRFSLSLVIESVRGLPSDDLCSVHLQIRLSSLLGPSVAEDTFASLPVDLSRSSASHMSLRKTISATATAHMLRYVAEESATVDFFAKVRPAYLDRLERWDRRETVSRPEMRRNETDFVAPEHHDVLLDVQVLEMANDGSYVSADVTGEVFQLHQGLQRRLRVTLSHTSGRALPLARVSYAGLKWLKANGVDIGAREVEVKMSSEVAYRADGTSSLVATGGWDTAAHEAVQLNRKTPSDQTLTLTLVLLVEIDSLDEPAAFSLEVPLRVLDRDARRSSLRFWSSAKTYTSTTAVYGLQLAAPLAHSAGELWRLDTAHKHVPGEEVLGGWRPRSLGLIREFEKCRRIQRCAGDVQVTRAVLARAQGDGEGDGGAEGERCVDGQEVLGRCVDLWVRAMEQRVQVDVRSASGEEKDVARRLRRLMPDLEPKLVPTVQRAVLGPTSIKTGMLMLLRDSQANEWEKVFFALRRPYLLLHPSSGEREVQVINLARAHVVASPDVEQLFQRRFAFTVFTSTNSFILQAPGARELSEWIAVIAATSES